MPEKIISRLSCSLSGVAGEYFVAAELSRKGYIATITLKNTEGVDILATNGKNRKLIGIQVKTNQDSANSWLLTKKAEDLFADDLFYVFVNLNQAKMPTYFIVPSKEVSVFVTENHKKWLEMPGKDGQKHNDSSMRVFKDSENKYLGRWELLGL